MSKCALARLWWLLILLGLVFSCVAMVLFG